jgi:hypothetical protein
MPHPLHKYARYVQQELSEGLPYRVSYSRCLRLVKKYWSEVEEMTNLERKLVLISLIREGESPLWLYSQASSKKEATVPPWPCSCSAAQSGQPQTVP